MDNLTCPGCNSQIPNSSPYRRTGRFVGDVTTCPNCGYEGNTRKFMKLTPSPGVGTELQKGPEELTPSQLTLQQLYQAAQSLDNKGLTKLADKIDKLLEK